MREILNDLIRELEAGNSIVLVTVVRHAGSTPRGPGARMLVRSNGSIVGTIGGGALEAYIHRSAIKVFASRASILVPFNLNPDDANSLGMICGGEGQVLVEYIDCGDPRWLQSYKLVAERSRQGTPAWMVSAVPSQVMAECAAGLWVVGSDCAIVARAGSDFGDAEALATLAANSRSFTVIKELGVMIDQAGNDSTALVFGAGHVARSLVPVLASIGFRTVVLDDRSEFVQPDHFDRADQLVLLDSFSNPFAGLSVTESSYIIIVTRGHVLDKSVLKQSLASQAGYIGLIGSRRKLHLTFQALLEEGITKEELERVHAPIGLEIGAESPAEIAVSIAAELIKVRAGRLVRGASA